LVLSANVAAAIPPVPPPMPDIASNDLSTFAWRLHRQIGEVDSNVVFSPLSIASVFAMLSAGAHGETLTELRRSLAFSGDDEAWHASQGALLGTLAALNREARDYQNALSLRVVNDLWLQQGFDVQPKFLDILHRHYRSHPQTLDFATDPETARQRINAKIASDTSELIAELLPQGSIGVDARLVLTNALYFKGGWESRFSEGATRPDVFHAIDGSTAEVPMMRVTDRFGYAKGDDWQAIRLPYDDGALEMLVLMPAAGRFRQIVETLDAQRLDSMLQDQQRTRIQLNFPRFSLRTTLPLVPVLQSAGLRRIFTDAAELDGIGNNLFVSAALHEAVIDVDENGTEAAAATAAVISLTSMPMREAEPLELRIDQPFIFVIRASASGAPLFIGQVLKL
jgi:serpin B